MSQMLHETAEAPDAVARMLQRNEALCVQLGERLRTAPPPFVVTCARGSSDHGATFAKYVIETQTGILTASAAPSISSIYHVELQMKGALFIAISQSGQSPDLLAATKAAQKGGALVLVIVNAEQSPLAELADIVLPLCAGSEVSVAATKSYITTLAALVQLVAHWSQNTALIESLKKLPGQLKAANALDWSPAAKSLAAAEHLLVVGRAASFGIAQEAALKFKETCCLHAEAFSAAEIRHGPMAILRNKIEALVFSQADETQPSVKELLPLLQAQGGAVFTAGIEGQKRQALPIVPDVHPVCAPITQVQSFYNLVNQVSIMRGLDPDQPPLLSKVTETI